MLGRIDCVVIEEGFTDVINTQLHLDFLINKFRSEIKNYSKDKYLGMFGSLSPNFCINVQRTDWIDTWFIIPISISGEMLVNLQITVELYNKSTGARLSQTANGMPYPRLYEGTNYYSIAFVGDYEFRQALGLEVNGSVNGFIKRFTVDLGFTTTDEIGGGFEEPISGWLASHNYNQKLADTVPTYLVREYDVNGSVIGSAMILGALTSCKGWVKFGPTVEVLHETATNSIVNMYSRVVNSVGSLVLKFDVTGKGTMSAKTVQEIGTIAPGSAYVFAQGKESILNALGFTLKLGKTLLPYATFLTLISTKVGVDETEIISYNGLTYKAKRIDKASYDKETQDYWKEQYEEYYNKPYDANAENPYQSEEDYNAENQASYDEYIKNAYGSMQNYFDKMLDFDSKLKAYEIDKLDTGTTAEMDDLNKRIASKRAEYLETDTGIYVGGQRVNATITDQGIFMGSGRIGATITPGGIYAAGDVVDSNGNPITPSGGTVSGNVNLVIPSGASIPVSIPTNSSIEVDASALDTVLTKGVAVNAEALDTTMAKGISINADPFAQFLTDNKINIDGTALQSAIEGNKIKIDTSELNEQTIPVSGSVTATGTVIARGEVSIAETSLEGISTLAENSTARELRETELHANKKEMLENQVNYKDKSNDITDADHKYKTQVIEEKDYAGQKAKAFTDLHSEELRESIALGQVHSLPKGLISSLIQAHLPALSMEIQQSKITENIRAENQSDDDDWDSDSFLMKLLFFNVDSVTKAEVMEKYGEELKLLLSISTPLGTITKIREIMGFGD